MAIITRIQVRRDTSANWASVNPVLASGEIGWDTTLGKGKVGNGTSTWSQLNFKFGLTADDLGLGEEDEVVFQNVETSELHVASDALVLSASGIAIGVTTISPTEIGYLDGVSSGIQTQLNAKQATLVSGTNLKTINAQSQLGSGGLLVRESSLDNWYRGGLSGKIVAWVGDSTSDATAAAAGLYSEYTAQSKAGMPLAGTTALDYGSNGNTLANFISDLSVPNATAKSFGALVAAAPDLIVICYGINDVRLGLTSQATLATNLKTLVAAIRQYLPNADIMLRVPNAFASRPLVNDSSTESFDPGSPAAAYVQVAGVAAGLGYTAACQLYSDILRNAYLQVYKEVPGLALLDVQKDVLTKVSAAFASMPWMSDSVHPNVNAMEAMIETFAKIAGRDEQQPVQPTFSKSRATLARGFSFTNDYTYFNGDALFDPNYYYQIADTYLAGHTNSTTILTELRKEQNQIVRPGDILVVGDAAPFVLNSTISLTDNTAITFINNVVAYSAAIQAQSVGARLLIFRKKHVSELDRHYWEGNVNYPYRFRFGPIYGIAANYIILASLTGEKYVDERTSLTTSDILVTSLGALTLSGFTFTPNAGNHTMNLIKVGDWSAYHGLTGTVYGNHTFEDGSRYRVANAYPWLQEN